MWGLGPLLVALGALGDQYGWWDSRPFLTNLISGLTGAMFGIPVALLLLPGLTDRDRRTRVQRDLVRRYSISLTRMFDAVSRLEDDGMAATCDRYFRAVDKIREAPKAKRKWVTDYEGDRERTGRKYYRRARLTAFADAALTAAQTYPRIRETFVTVSGELVDNWHEFNELHPKLKEYELTGNARSFVEEVERLVKRFAGTASWHATQAATGSELTHKAREIRAAVRRQGSQKIRKSRTGAQVQFIEAAGNQLGWHDLRPLLGVGRGIRTAVTDLAAALQSAGGEAAEPAADTAARTPPEQRPATRTA